MANSLLLHRAGDHRVGGANLVCQTINEEHDVLVHSRPSRSLSHQLPEETDGLLSSSFHSDMMEDEDSVPIVQSGLPPTFGNGGVPFDRHHNYTTIAELLAT